MSTRRSLTEPVTLSRAAALTDVSRSVLERLVERGKLQPRACMVDGRRTLLFELWEVEAALDARRAYRRVVVTPSPIGVGFER
jgi:predicted DNA-binding protein (UPF0251 family)